MLTYKEVPLDLWKRDDINDVEVLAETISETRQAIEAIKGFSEILQIDPLEEKRVERLNHIIAAATYLESIMNAASEYVIYSQTNKGSR